MLKHTAVFSISVVMAVCFSILLVHRYVWWEIFRFRPAVMQLGGLPLANGACNGAQQLMSHPCSMAPSCVHAVTSFLMCAAL